MCAIQLPLKLGVFTLHAGLYTLICNGALSCGIRLCKVSLPCGTECLQDGSTLLRLEHLLFAAQPIHHLTQSRMLCS
ncbi:hypothetical protein AB1Y20_008108 [Prymnesium parvum]|uniref:Secreted protein n=1 Tax=Prymnesium parvum TaxID=97485 RepID=A0AB34IVX1_PRYPA